MASLFAFRPNSSDENTFNAINLQDEYRLPSAFQPDDIIIDIGAHISSFCYAALVRGSNHVYGFEADLENYNCAAANLISFGNRVHLYHKAVWRSDKQCDRLFHTGYSYDKGLVNTGGGNVLWATEGQDMEAIAFDDIIWEITDYGKKRVRLVKIDAEGAEFPILLTSHKLHLIDCLCGEYHEIGGEHDTNSMPENAQLPGYDHFLMAELAAFLNQTGFDVESFSHGRNLGMFFATRRGRVQRLISAVKVMFQRQN